MTSSITSVDLDNTLKIMGLQTSEAFRSSCFSSIRQERLEGLEGEELHKAIEKQVRSFLHTGGTKHDNP